MKLLLSVVCAVVALAGCVSTPPTPTEPGTGSALCAHGGHGRRRQGPIRQRRGRLPTAATWITARSESGDAMWLGFGLITVHGQGIVAAAAQGELRPP